MPTTALTFLSVLALTVATMPMILWGVRRLHLVDLPNGRSSHAQPTLRGGGLAAAIGILVVTALAPNLGGSARPALLVATVLFGVIGMIDDLVGLDAKKALALQVVAAAPVVPVLLSGDEGISPAPWAFAAALFWIVAFTNVFNFMDGIDGISAVQAILVGASWWVMGATENVTVLATAGAILTGAAVAFAPFNFPRARVFLGSVGSYVIGAFIAVVAVLALRANLRLDAVMAPLVLYLADTGTTLARRVLSGERWWEAHCDHAYQRLVRLGWSHVQTTLFVGSLIATCSLLGLLALAGGVWRLGGDAGIVAVVGVYLATPALLTRTGRRPAGAAGGVVGGRSETAD